MSPQGRGPLTDNHTWKFDEGEAGAAKGKWSPWITLEKFGGKKFLLAQKRDKSYYILTIKC